MGKMGAMDFIAYAGTFGSRLGIETIEELLKRLGNPQNARPVIHVAGTNGKGSIFAFLEGCLKEAGYRVGRYISPTLFGYLERYQINGIWMEQVVFEDLCQRVKRVCDAMVKDGFLHPTAFEVETAIAFLYFEMEAVDVVLLETGMGGAEDATNVVAKPLATVFASISMDHMSFLGDSIEEIVLVKSGIMRQEVPVVIAPMEATARSVLCERARELNAPVTLVKKPKAKCRLTQTSFVYNGEEYSISLAGTFQPENAACAIAVCDLIQDALPMSLEQRKKGLQNATWNGRFEVVNERPYIIRDGAHNVDAARRLKETLKQYFPNKKITFVMGVYKDKQYDDMIAEVSELANAFYTVTPPNPERALSAKTLRAHIISIVKDNPNIHNAVEIKAFGNMSNALFYAQDHSQNDDVIVVFGSLSLASLLED